MPAHLFVIHFPVALVVLGAALDAVGAVGRRTDVRRWGGLLIMLGAGAALLAFWTGQGALDNLSRGAPLLATSAVEVHSQWGGAGVWPLAGAGVFRSLWRSRLEGPAGWLNLAVAVAAALLAIAITLSGSAIRHAA